MTLPESKATEPKETDTSQTNTTRSSSSRTSRQEDKGVSVSPDLREGVPVLISELGSAKDMNKDVSELGICNFLTAHNWQK